MEFTFTGVNFHNFNAVNNSLKSQSKYTEVHMALLIKDIINL